MSYVDGYIASVLKINKDKYIEHAKSAAVVFKEYGALKIVENWEDEVPDGEVTSFPMAVKKQPDEAIVFSWIVWPSKGVRDSGWQKVMEDPRMQPDENPMPFDGKRLIYGGFNTILDV
ncbi:DUF1428 domain-containing protein [Paraglaciecola sp.]|uniref:DUF1428 domain-containing protein n=1 Tax=Paraglaciecola sp. TaxID=1920173 RepID=UPI003267B1FE